MKMKQFKIFFPIFLTFISILTPVILYLVQANEKSLSYRIIKWSLASTEMTIVKEDLKMLFLGQQLDDLSFAKVEIQNTGDIPILKRDFERNIVIDFGENAKVLKSYITTKEPFNLEASVRLEENSACLSPLLLNPEDKLIIEFIVHNPGNEIVFNARINGIKLPTEIVNPTYYGIFMLHNKRVLFACIFMFFYGHLISLNFKFNFSNFTKELIIKCFIVNAIAIIALICGRWFYESSKYSNIEKMLFYISAIMGAIVFLITNSLWNFTKDEKHK